MDLEMTTAMPQAGQETVPTVSEKAWEESPTWSIGTGGGSGREPTPFRARGDARPFYKWCQEWTATLGRLRQTFDGDLDQYLLLLTFLQAEMARTVAALPQAGRQAAQELAPRGLNALSVAEICAVPRETTRRKLGLLVKKGYLMVGQDGLFYLTDRYGLIEALLDLAPLYTPTRLSSETDGERSWKPWPAQAPP
jgi:hypothetical protein